MGYANEETRNVKRYGITPNSYCGGSALFLCLL